MEKTVDELIQPILKEIEFPVYYDDMGQFIFDQDGRMLIDVRGWGWIQKLGPDADKMQAAFGKKLCEMINSLKP